MKFDSGVKGYVFGRAIVEMSFPVDFRGVIHACCGLCRYYGKSVGICRLTDERILYPETNVGNECPIEFNEREEK